ncbi:MAG: hypothetical protein HOE48_07970 [Candidatus Latescibacteria bacterium]|nr:hypothetical protein [Candidatus Latescibacterota bacterium]
MSLRTLTTQLQQEKVEHQRVLQFQSARSIQDPQAQQEAPKQTPFMVGASNRKQRSENTPSEIPIQRQTASPKIGLKERELETTYGVPGGIVARFGRNALKEPVVAPQELQEIVATESRSESVLNTPLEEADKSNEEEAEPQEQEQAVEEDEAARITIELQSH